jgi:hypothetical protein
MHDLKKEGIMLSRHELTFGAGWDAPTVEQMGAGP